MNAMDEYCAPQWTDFTSSPQVPSEDFFEKEHEVHERQVRIKVKEPEVSLEEVIDVTLEPETISQTRMDTLQNIPVKVLSCTSRNNNKAELVQETTTYNDVLCEAMKNLQLSAKRNKCLNLTVQPICQSTTPNFKTPTVPKMRGSHSVGVHRTIVDRSLSAASRKSNARRSVLTPTTSKNASTTTTPKDNEVKSAGKTAKEVSKKDPKKELKEESKEELKKELKGELREELKEELQEEPKEGPKEESHEEVQLLVPEVTVESESETDSKQIEVDSKTELNAESKNTVEDGDADNKRRVPANIRTSFSSVESNSTKGNRRSFNHNRPRVLTCQYRRRSLAKYSRRSNQFVSLAEAVSKFQTGTPKRFRTTSQANAKLGPVGKLKQAALKPTIGISPVLKCKTRIRRVTALSQEERENLELEEIKKHQIKANPIKMSALKGEPVLKKHPKKPITVPEPFHLTQLKKPSETVEPKQEPVRKKPSVAKTSVPTVVSTSDAGIVVAKEKVLFFGVPADSNVKNRTHAIPFSFESRNREFQTRKEQKLRQLQLQESNKTRAEFHARPVPKYSKPVAAVKEQNAKKAAVVPCPFSFEKRDRNLLERKEKLVQQVLEEDRKARIFHANPVPVFKPVMVRGTSKENLKAKTKEPEPPKKTVAPVACKKPTIVREAKHDVQDEQENKEPNIVDDESNVARSKPSQQKEMKAPRLTELNTDKRAKERRAFDEKLKQKELEEEAKRVKDEEDRLAREMAERAELRKLAEVKAKPMPVYKPLIPAKATKPLTNPQSPAWTIKSKAKNAA